MFTHLFIHHIHSASRSVSYSVSWAAGWCISQHSDHQLQVCLTFFLYKFWTNGENSFNLFIFFICCLKAEKFPYSVLACFVHYSYNELAKYYIWNIIIIKYNHDDYARDFSKCRYILWTLISYIPCCPWALL